ncbi:hypothetical protein HN011_009313 [Eciton burchellii]|nr:hypothetical protein HN011_009313 [Eciton burchellii]
MVLAGNRDKCTPNYNYDLALKTSRERSQSIRIADDGEILLLKTGETPVNVEWIESPRFLHCLAFSFPVYSPQTRYVTIHASRDSRVCRSSRSLTEGTMHLVSDRISL